MTFRRPLPAVIMLTLVLAGQAERADTQPGQVMLSQPAITKGQIAFVFDGDIWIASPEGFRIRRLTSAPGDEVNPVFSPDGKSLAFSARYDGNLDVYLMDLAEGLPRRLTWHPGDDYVLGFEPTRGDVLFRSSRSSVTDRQPQLFLVSATGGFPKRLPLPAGFKGVFSPDGTHLAYVPLPEAFEQWKGYRGGRASRIWIIDLETLEWREIPQPAGRCNDTDPMWFGEAADGTIVFRSDRAGEFTLFSYDVKKGGTPRRVLDPDAWPIVDASYGDGRVIFERQGRLYRVTPTNRNGRATASAVKAQVPAELRERRPRWVGRAADVRAADIGPAGRRVALEFRGEILTLPVADGGALNLTESSEAHERSPVFSPSGDRIAYFSDARPKNAADDDAGEYALHIHTISTGEVTTLAVGKERFFSDPRWSPDGKSIAFVDHTSTLYALELESTTLTTIAEQPTYGPRDVRRVEFAWSPDSRWIAYTSTQRTHVRRLRLYGFDAKASCDVSGALFDASDPAFDASGSYLFFLGSTDAGPSRQWFDQSSGDSVASRSIYCAVLHDDLPSPFKRRRTGDAPKEPTPGDDRTIRTEGLESRVVRFPLPAGNYDALQSGAAGDVYFLASSARDATAGALCRYRFASGAATTLFDRADEFTVTRSGEHVLYRHGERWFASATDEPSSNGRLHVERIRVRSDPPSEWKQIFREAWRINRDRFYDPNHHGANWKLQFARYSEFLPHLATRRDLNRVIRWMGSELGVGHHRVSGGESLDAVEPVPVGLLGADFEVAGKRYKFAKIYRGVPWDPTLRSPLAEPGAQVRDGEYLIAVRGRDLTSSTNLFARFENTVGSVIEITVAEDANGTGKRTIEVVPIADESGLRLRSWAEANRRHVDDATRGQVAYVYVPNTTSEGLAAFKRAFFPQADRKALIIDERFNRGGQVADYFIDLLRREHIAYWATREGDLESPSALIPGPKVMITDETAGSGGDLLPWMFRKFGLGRIVGRPTWGGLVGALAAPVLMDGGRVTAPDLAIWTGKGGWIVENVGVAPDHLIEQHPAEAARGEDSQLEAAIRIVKQLLKESPPTKPKRPAFPKRGNGAKSN